MDEIERELQDVDREITRLTLLQPLHIGQAPTDVEIEELEYLYKRHNELCELLSPN